MNANGSGGCGVCESASRNRKRQSNIFAKKRTIVEQIIHLIYHIDLQRLWEPLKSKNARFCWMAKA